MKKSMFFWFFIGASVMAASAKVPGAGPTQESTTLMEMLGKAGWVMYPLYAVSLIVVALIFYYFAALRTSRVVTEDTRRALEALIREGNFAGLLETARANPQILARVIERAVRFKQDNPDADFAAVREVATAEGNRQASALNQMVVYLMDMGVLAPMLGLMGTVVGILRSFGTIAKEEATAMRTLLLAGGVSQALVATAVGLVVGITAMFFYSYFRGRAQKLISELETSATALIAQMGLKLK